MEELFKSIECSIENTVKKFSSAISKKYKIEQKDLEKMWSDISSNIEFISNNQKESTKKEKKKAVETDNKSVKSSKSSEDGCVYLFVRGKNSGSQCGSKTTNGDYCAKHKDKENVNQKSKKTLPKPKSISSNVKSAPTSPSLPKKISKVIRENKDIKRFWHPETQLVFKSRDERVVIGRLKDDVICDLDEDDVKLCESYGFKMEEKKVESSKDSDIDDVLNKIMEEDVNDDEEEEEEYLEEEDE